MTELIGIYGGTFDPVHNGHIQMAREFCRQCHLKQLYIVPCHISPLRSSPSAADNHRLAMLQKATESTQWIVDPRELLRGGKSFTIDTLESMHAELNDSQALVLCMGADAFLGFTRWHRWQDILNLSHIAIAHRPGYKINPDTDSHHLLKQRQVTDLEGLHQERNGRIYLVNAGKMPVSSTQVRKLLAQQQYQLCEVPDSVKGYIKEKQLYQSTPE